MAIKVLKAADIGVSSRKVTGTGLTNTLAAMKPGQAIQAPTYGCTGLFHMANLVCPDRQWRQRKGDDGKVYVICIAKDEK